MRYTEIFREAERLHKLGFAIHWLHPRSKRPIESGWTSGPRKEWKYLAETYVAGLNVGVRLGEASRIAGNYLTVVDVDVKSKDREHRRQALAAAKRLLVRAGLETDLPPTVLSGRGGGSRHIYCLSPKTFKTWNPVESEDWLKYHGPTKAISKRDRQKLSEEELEKGLRWGRAWEISLYSYGRQVVLPPSVHPDSGELYAWKAAIQKASDLPVLSFPAESEGDAGDSRDAGREERGRQSHGSVREANGSTERSEGASRLEDFQIESVDLGWLSISKEVRDGIVDGTGVNDRSAFLLKASSALLSAGLSQNEVLTVLTDPETFLGAVGYDHAQTKDRARAAAWVYKYTFKKVAKERSAEGIFGKASDARPTRKLTKEEQEEQAAEFAEMRDWKQGLVRGGQGGSGPPQKLVQNVVLILKNAVSPLVVKRDEFAYRDTYDLDTPWGGKIGQALNDDEVAKIKYWLGVHWRFEPNNNVISDALTVIACQNSYDPARDWLEGLPAWDGKERLNTWLRKHFEARGNREYLAQVFRKWMFAMVLRVYQPGAKFDWMPIFEGAQGVGKSSFGRLLVGDKYFLDWLPNLNDKDSALSLQGMWGVEMGELSQFRKNELENIKAFITRTVDKLRPPYGRRLIESPRRCVFFGTTNRETYLVDETGNRRFKPIVVGALDFEALRAEREQLFAEAKWLYDQKKETALTLDLTGEAKEYEQKIQLEKMVEDDSHAMGEAFEIFVEKIGSKKVNFDLSGFKILDLFGGVGPLVGWRPDNKNFQFAARMLKRRGAKMRKVRGTRVWELGENDLKFETRHPIPTPTKNGESHRENSFF